MATFGASSKIALATCHPELQKLANLAIQYVDFAILEGYRNKERQDADYAKGVSKLKWPNSNHNRKPSDAFDFAPFPIDWSSRTVALARFLFVAGVLHTCAVDLGLKIRFGWDWNRNLDPRDESFLDWGHVERDV